MNQIIMVVGTLVWRWKEIGRLED